MHLNYQSLTGHLYQLNQAFVFGFSPFPLNNKALFRLRFTNQSGYLFERPQTIIAVDCSSSVAHDNAKSSTKTNRQSFSKALYLPECSIFIYLPKMRHTDFPKEIIYKTKIHENPFTSLGHCKTCQKSPPNAK